MTMKHGWIALSIAALLLAILWTARIGTESSVRFAPAPLAGAETEPGPPEVRSAELSAEAVPAPRAGSSPRSAAIAPASAPTRSSADSVDAPPPLMDFATLTGKSGQPDLSENERSFFQAKYAASGEEQRRAAIQALEDSLRARKVGGVDEGGALSTEQILAYGREIAWLLDNPKP